MPRAGQPGRTGTTTTFTPIAFKVAFAASIAEACFTETESVPFEFCVTAWAGGRRCRPLGLGPQRVAVLAHQVREELISELGHVGSRHDRRSGPWPRRVQRRSRAAPRTGAAVQPVVDAVDAVGAGTASALA